MAASGKTREGTRKEQRTASAGKLVVVAAAAVVVVTAAAAEKALALDLSAAQQQCKPGHLGWKWERGMKRLGSARCCLGAKVEQVERIQ